MRTTTWTALLARFEGQRGQTMPEYALLLSAIALVILVIALTLGQDIASVLGFTASHV